MAGKGIFSNLPGGEQITYLKVKKPVSNSSREIRDAILRDHFGYTNADIEALDLQKKISFKVCNEDETKWATPQQVLSWKPELNGEISIPVSDSAIYGLNSFREQRASFEVFKVGIFITDVEIKQDVLGDLEKILLKSGNERLIGLNNLMITIAGSAASRSQIFKALRFLLNESGYKNNPFLMIAFASTTAYKNETPAFGSAVVNQSSIANAVRMTNERLYNNSSKSALTAISRAEAAQINFWASQLYDNINANDQATNRRWIERMLNMSDAESSSLKEGDVFSIADPARTAVRKPFQSEINLQEAMQNMARKRQEWSETDKMGKDQSFDLKGDHRQTEYYQGRSGTIDPDNPTSPLLQNDSYVTEASGKKQKNRGETTQDIRLSSSMSNNPEVFIQIFRWTALLRRLLYI